MQFTVVGNGKGVSCAGDLIGNPDPWLRRNQRIFGKFGLYFRRDLSF